MPSIVWVRTVLKKACGVGQVKLEALPSVIAVITTSCCAGVSSAKDLPCAFHHVSSLLSPWRYRALSYLTISSPFLNDKSTKQLLKQRSFEVPPPAYLESHSCAVRLFCGAGRAVISFPLLPRGFPLA